MKKNIKGGQHKNYEIPYLVAPKKKEHIEKLQDLLSDIETTQNGIDEVHENNPLMRQPQMTKCYSSQTPKAQSTSKDRLNCPYFPPTMIQILEFICSLETYNKIYGHFIVDEQLKILFADRHAKQLLEGSLSSLNSSVLDFVVMQDRERFIEKCNRSIQDLTWFDFLIYSRGSLRKYDLFPELETPNNLDYFFRYLKSLTSQIVPICMDFSDFSSYSSDDVFWNKNQIIKGCMTKCFLFKTCYSLEIPDLSKYDFSKDTLLSKYKTIMDTKKNRAGLSNQQKIDDVINWQQVQQNNSFIIGLRKTKSNIDEIKRESTKITKTENLKFIESKITPKLNKLIKKQTLISSKPKRVCRNSIKNLENMVLSQHHHQNPEKIQRIKIPKTSLIKTDQQIIQAHSYYNPEAQYSHEQNSVNDEFFDQSSESNIKPKIKVQTDIYLQIRQDDEYIAQFLT